jgi:hypothetical protein
LEPERPNALAATRRWLAACIAGAACLATACATAPHWTEFDSALRRDLRLGQTTTEEVLSMFDHPMATQMRATGAVDSTIDTWRFVGQEDNAYGERRLSIEYVAGVVNGYMFFSTLPKDDTDFSIENYQNLRDNAAWFEDVRRLAGPPDGELRLPTNLLEVVFSRMPEVLPPEGATQADVYFHVALEKKNHDWKKTTKLLVAFGSADGKVLSVRRFVGQL